LRRVDFTGSVACVLASYAIQTRDRSIPCTPLPKAYCPHCNIRYDEDNEPALLRRLRPPDHVWVQRSLALAPVRNVTTALARPRSSAQPQR